MPEIVEEPAIELGIAQCSLNFSHPFCWRFLLCIHWCDNRGAKNDACEDVNASHKSGGNLTTTPFLGHENELERFRPQPHEYYCCQGRVNHTIEQITSRPLHVSFSRSRAAISSP